MAVTALVVTVNVAIKLPAGTVMLEGTVAAELMLGSDTAVPREGREPPSELCRLKCAPEDCARINCYAGYPI